MWTPFSRRRIGETLGVVIVVTFCVTGAQAQQHQPQQNQAQFYFSGGHSRFIPTFQQQQNGYFVPPQQSYRQQNFPHDDVDIFQNSEISQKFQVSSYPTVNRNPTPFQLPPPTSQSSQFSPYLVNEPLPVSSQQAPSQLRSRSPASSSFLNVPSTHRPQFSHLLSQSSHNHDPSQTETFLGQITIQSPDEIPQFRPSGQFPFPQTHDVINNRFPSTNQQKWARKPVHEHYSIDNIDQDLEDYNTEDEFLSTSSERASGKNHKENPNLRKKPENAAQQRSRFNLLPPQQTATASEHVGRSYKSNIPSNDYFINNNEEVYTVRNRFKSSSTSKPPAPVIPKDISRFSSTTREPIVNTFQSNKPSRIQLMPKSTVAVKSESGLNIESLLEEEKEQPLNKYHNSDDDDVEVIQSLTLPINKVDTQTEYYNVASNSTHDEETTVHGHVDSLLTTDNEQLDPSDSDYYENTEDYHDEILEDSTHVADLDPKRTHGAETEQSNVGVSNTTNAHILKALVENGSPSHTEESDYVDSYTTFTSLDQPTLTNADIENAESDATTIENVEYTTEIPNTSNHLNNTTFDIVTVNPPSGTVEDNNFKEFIDTMLMDSTEDPVKAIVDDEVTTDHISIQSSILMQDYKTTTSIADSVEDTTEKPIAAPILLGEAVVSVVTTKSVINGTISIPPTLPPAVTVQMQVPVQTNASEENVNNTTENWKVIASVQTSRSISGARFLPFDIVEQEEKAQTLLADDENKNVTTSNGSKRSSDDSFAKDLFDFDLNSPDKPRPSSSSTESIIDKLDRVQSELSSGFLTGGFKSNNSNFTVITEQMPDKVDTPVRKITSTTQKPTTQTPVTIRKFSPFSRPSTQRPNSKKTSFLDIKMDDISGLLPANFKPRYSGRKTTTTTTTTVASVDVDQPQGDEPMKPPVFETKQRNSSSGRSSGLSNHNRVLVQDDLSALLPRDYKPAKEHVASSKNSTFLDNLLSKIKNDSKNLTQPSAKPKETTTEKETKLLENAKPVDISAFLPPNYKPPSTEKAMTEEKVIKNSKPVDISAFLPPGFKLSTSTEKPKSFDKVFEKNKVANVSTLLPPNYKPPASTEKPKGIPRLLDTAQPLDITNFLPPGYKIQDKGTDMAKPDIKVSNSTTKENSSNKTESTNPPPSNGNSKFVFASRPGGKKPINRATTHKPVRADGPSLNVPQIRKGLPTRATTEFSGWPTPSTTPISIEKLLEAARTATGSTSSSSSTSTTTTTTTSSTTTTTTTPRPTTPGICSEECDLAATIKLVGGAKWVPELLDHNTKEWQLLANEVQTQLENVYSASNRLSKWYKKIRIDGFSPGSVLVDYFIELNEIGRTVNTQELKQMFHAALHPVPMTTTSNSDEFGENNEFLSEIQGKLNLGSFIVDPQYTDFIVLPKQVTPTVGYANENVFLPQWAIAVIVIGLASLLFVIIFGVTVLVNRQKNAKKKQPTPLTEDMLNELNKNHMGGFDNYGAEDLYNMEDVWNEKAYDTKPPKKRSAGSLHENSMSNLYDSWRSEWNGYYYNAYYGNPSSSASASGYARRRSDYDTNF